MAYGTCTCCCCCAHWAGAGILGTWGIVSAVLDEKKDRAPATHPTARKYVVVSASVAATITAALVATAIFLVDTGPSLARDVVETSLIILAFFPSLAFIPICMGAIIGALLAKLRIAMIRDAEQEQRPVRAMRLAWRITWKSFLWSAFGTGIGYLMIHLYFAIADF
jgi:hypothetical protein